jgi:hypothetical protein
MFSELRALRVLRGENFLSDKLDHRIHENSSTSTVPTNMPATALLVLYATAIVTAKATARYGAACVSKRAPDMKSVIEISPHKSA